MKFKLSDAEQENQEAAKKKTEKIERLSTLNYRMYRLKIFWSLNWKHIRKVAGLLPKLSFAYRN